MLTPMLGALLTSNAVCICTYGRTHELTNAVVNSVDISHLVSCARKGQKRGGRGKK